jgi:hypothetical protein
VHGFAVEQLQAIGGDVLGQAEVTGVGGLAGRRQGMSQPVGNVLGNLPNAGLGQGKIGSGLAGRGTVEEEALVDLEVAGAGREGQAHGKVSSEKIKEPKNQKDAGI